MILAFSKGDIYLLQKFCQKWANDLKKKHAYMHKLFKMLSKMWYKGLFQTGMVVTITIQVYVKPLI